MHTLTNGARVMSLSAHGFKFSDGTECGQAPREVVEALTLERETRKVGEVYGMDINKTSMVLSDAQFDTLDRYCAKADIVIVPFPVLVALRESGRRYEFPNAVAFNATPETRRSRPDEKIVDINNWSY